MACKSDVVKHAMLALASTYILDYLPDERVRQRSNAHYNTAVRLLTQKLAGEHKPSGGEDVVASIALLNTLDVVSPERRRPKDQVPRWLEGASVACRVLDVTDLGHRYWNPDNVQPSEARVANTIISSRAVIVALTMMPLDQANTENGRFQWLLAQSSEANTRKIHGSCGCSPRLLHRFAQITHLAALLEEDPHSVVVPLTAETILQEIEELRQWSDLSSPYFSTAALLQACDQNSDPSIGIVSDKGSMTNLTAEAWRLAAMVYMQCRVLR